MALTNQILSYLKQPQFFLPIAWVMAVHFIELIMLPSLSAQAVNLKEFSLTERYLNIWFFNSDANYYYEIAKKAYEDTSPVFFPAWPLIAKITGPSLIGMKILALIFTLSFFAFIPLALRALKVKVKLEIFLISLVAFPASFILNAPMTEPLFLFLSVLTIINTEKGNFKNASLLIAVASATRPNGSLLAVYLFIKIATKGIGSIKRNWWTLPISVSGIIVYSLYLHFARGDFFAFYHEQQYWNNSISLESINKLVVEQKTIFLQIFSTYKPIPLKIYQLGSIIFFIFLSAISFRKINKALWSYCFLAILLPLISGTHLATSRYLLASFPFFIPLAQILQKNKLLFYTFIFVSLYFQAYLITRFLNFEAT